MPTDAKSSAVIAARPASGNSRRSYSSRSRRRIRSFAFGRPRESRMCETLRFQETSSGHAAFITAVKHVILTEREGSVGMGGVDSMATVFVGFAPTNPHPGTGKPHHPKPGKDSGSGTNTGIHEIKIGD